MRREEGWLRVKEIQNERMETEVSERNSNPSNQANVVSSLCVDVKLFMFSSTDASKTWSKQNSGKLCLSGIKLASKKE